jgi:Papain-like cysteine protease AvrRpt2
MSLILRSATPLDGARVSTTIPPTWRVETIDVKKQDLKKWCWAAIGSALTHHYHPGAPMTQQQVASRVLPKDCVANPDACNKMATMTTVLERLSFADGEANKVLFDEIAIPIAANRPIVIRVVRLGTPHFVLVKGYAQGPRWLAIDDPSDGETRDIPYDALFRGQAHQLGSWTHTFWTKGH